jgi:hypothetical protein
MLIPLQEIAKFHTIENVLHVGAHLGEEAAEYYKHGVKRSLWIDANSDLLSQLQKNLANYKKCTNIKCNFK